MMHLLNAGSKLKVYNTIRRNLERLLNLLYTFNLCPVSGGLHRQDIRSQIFVKHVSLIILWEIISKVISAKYFEITKDITLGNIYAVQYSHWDK